MSAGRFTVCTGQSSSRSPVKWWVKDALSIWPDGPFETRGQAVAHDKARRDTTTHSAKEE